MSENDDTDVYKWIVLKRDPLADSAFTGRVWVEIGELHTDFGYTAPDAEKIGALGGGGEYLLLNEESHRIMRRTILAETRYIALIEPVPGEQAA